MSGEIARIEDLRYGDVLQRTTPRGEPVQMNRAVMFVRWGIPADPYGDANFVAVDIDNPSYMIAPGYDPSFDPDSGKHYWRKVG
jgi:hypothetical protein